MVVIGQQIKSCYCWEGSEISQHHKNNRSITNYLTFLVPFTAIIVILNNIISSHNDTFVNYDIKTADSAIKLN